MLYLEMMVMVPCKVFLQFSFEIHCHGNQNQQLSYDLQYV